MAGRDTLFCLRGEAQTGQTTGGSYVKAFTFDADVMTNTPIAVATCDRCGKKHEFPVDDHSTIRFPFEREQFVATFEGMRMRVGCRGTYQCR